MSKPHKHAELIKAWADGAEIQFKHYEYKFCDGVWIDFAPECTPSWDEKIEYRIKPEPKPDVVRYTHIYLNEQRNDWDYQRGNENVMFRFDGETGKLKSAEVLE